MPEISTGRQQTLFQIESIKKEVSRRLYQWAGFAIGPKRGSDQEF
ncbi:hypothetical protein [Bradyrhizobium sp. SRL28]|nr:hypothetical protein [Bradyrhizobium sp. SRL28]